MHTDKKATVHLIELLVQKGVKDFIISPGSRNAPIINELVGREDVNLYSIPDERSAAFVAIGMYLKTKKAAAVVCTSGSALLNYAPAVAEAFYQGIPLFVLSADRPAMWIDQGEGQTIRQKNALQNFINDELNIPLDAEIEDYQEVDISICKSIDKAFLPSCAPVHINIEYEEPLYNAQDTYSGDEVLFIRSSAPLQEEIDFEDYKQRLKKSKKILILCGQHTPDNELSELLHNFAQNEQVIVLTESTSNLHSPLFIPSIDKTLIRIEKNFKAFQADVLITIGDAIVSKIVKRVLRNHPPKEHWQVSSSGVFRDTYQCLSDPLHIEPKLFFEKISVLRFDHSSDYAASWRAEYEKACSIYEEYRKTLPFSDYYVFDFLFSAIAENSDIHIANSSPIRYQQLFSAKHYTYCNRGTSGIDGCSSTALGFSLKSTNPTWLITGDISFLYDSNAWWNSYSTDLKIILINNGGGGIFRIIPGPTRIAGFEHFFETHHEVDIQSLCKAFSIDYFAASDQKSLEQNFKKLHQNKGISLLEIKTPREINAAMLNKYFELLRTEN
jgi:2-succinyl-5-enolpyruvyl-6-hydroxy-3-cyclohexene-1-carboxylate synthase